MWAAAWGTSFWIDPKEQLAGTLYKKLVYGAMI
jgi:hypothetical protein